MRRIRSGSSFRAKYNGAEKSFKDDLGEYNFKDRFIPLCYSQDEYQFQILGKSKNLLALKTNCKSMFARYFLIFDTETIKRTNLLGYGQTQAHPFRIDRF